MFLFPLTYLASFFYAITKLFKKQVDGFLIFVIVGLPIYINAMSVSFMYGFSRWIPLLQSFKELAVLGACLLVVTQIKQRPVLHLIDKLIIGFFVYTLLYVIVPIGSYTIMAKLMALKNLSFFCLLYFIGRFCDKDQVNINKLFSFIVIVLLVATIVVFGERILNQHLHSFTGFSDYNFYFFNTDASGNYGLLWTFETESSAKRFGSIFSNPLEFASAIVLSLAIMFALISSKNNTEPNAIIQTNPNTLEKIGLIASFICIVLALSRAAFISYFLVFVPLAFGLGEKFIPERIQSLILMYLIFGFGYLVVWMKYKVGQLNPSSLAISQISLLVVFITLLFFNQNSKQFYGEWRFDKAKKYANENAQRFDLILKSKNQQVVIPPIENKNTMFFMEELSTDPKHLWCKCIANYYGKADIHLGK